MSVFVDTSGLLALLDPHESRHQAAAGAWQELLARDERLVTTSYVLVEAYALVQRRLGTDAARALTEAFVPLLTIEWIDEGTHGLAVSALHTAGRRGLSLVDCASFVVMRRRGLRRALALDTDFETQGFETLPAP